MKGPLNAVLVAGGRLHPGLSHLHPTGIKALAEVGGETLLERALGAVRDLSRLGPWQVEEVAVVGEPPVGELLASRGWQITWTDVGEHGVENVLRGLMALERELPTLVMATDLPLVGAEELARFLAAVPPSAEFAMPVVTREAFLGRFPGAPNRFERLREGHLTLGSVAFLRPAAFRMNYPLLTDAFRLRKRPLKIALLAGPSTILKWALGSLSVDDLVRRARKITAAEVHAVMGMPPELAYDIDQPENWHYLMRLMGEVG